MATKPAASREPMFPILGEFMAGGRSLVRGTSRLCAAYEVGCNGIHATTVAVVEISAIAAQQQQQRLLNQLQSTAEPTST